MAMCPYRTWIFERVGYLSRSKETTHHLFSDRAPCNRRFGLARVIRFANA
jgi:hypothetical protein